MAKDEREILSAVRFGGIVYKPGMEDELESALSKEEIQRLTDRGAVSGFGAKAKESEDEKPKSKK